MKIVKRILVIIVVLLLTPMLFYGLGDLIRMWNRVHVKDEFYIAYLESYSSMSLCNDAQSFVGGVSEAYWNNDSLVVSGRNGCFLIEFGKTRYNDQMIEIPCERINEIIQKGPIEKYKN